MSESLGKRLARQAWSIMPARSYSGVVGWAARRHLPALMRPTVLGTFARSFGIDVSEAEKPLEAYTGVDDFFTRRLRPDSRPIDPAPDAIVSPADGLTVAVGPVSTAGRIEAKNIDFHVADLLGDQDVAGRFHGGQFATVYLSPRDYHRVHTPAAGQVRSWRHLPGTLYPVNRASTEREPELFARNERVVTLLDGPPGRFAVVMVAAVGVGHITLTFDHGVRAKTGGDADDAVHFRDFGGSVPQLARGEELGIFHLGSTAIILFERDRVVLEPDQTGQVARLGARIGKIVDLRQ